MTLMWPVSSPTDWNSQPLDVLPEPLPLRLDCSFGRFLSFSFFFLFFLLLFFGFLSFFFFALFVCLFVCLCVFMILLACLIVCRL